MSDHQQSPFVSTNTPFAHNPVSSSASPGHFDQQFYTQHATMPALPHYGMSYNHFFVADDLHSIIGHDQYFEQPECMTPLSQHSMVDHASVVSDIIDSSLQVNSLEVISGHSTGSRATFVTPTWTPEPMQFERHSREVSIQAASPRLLPQILPRHQQADSSDSTMTVEPLPARLSTPIAPLLTIPNQKPSLKRTASREDLPQQSPLAKRRRSASPTVSPSTELSAEDELLLRLKDQEHLTWREIQSRFEVEMNKTHHIPALQMRIKRLRERMRVWTDNDVDALRMAHDYWNDNKFEIIARKMMEFGAQEKWSSKQCFKKWHEITPQPDYFQPSFQSTPTVSTPTFQPASARFSPGFMPLPQSSEAYQPFVSTAA